MRRRLPALLGMSLLLTGCAAGPTDPSTPQSTAESPAAETGHTATPLSLGQWAPADCPPDQPCDVEFRITDILISDTCEFGLKPDAEPLAEGTELLTMYTEARSELTANGEAHLFTTPEVLDSHGEIQPASYDQPCADKPGHADFQYLLTGIEENSEAQFADMLAVPAGSQALLFEDRRIELTATGAKAGSFGGADAPVGPAGEAGAGSAPDTGRDESGPHQVGDCTAGGQAMFSDGRQRPVADCAAGESGDDSGNSDTEIPYRCADTGEQVTDPADCTSTPSKSTTPKPSPSTTPARPTITHPNPGSFLNDYEAQLWTDCANGEVSDKLLCGTMYDLYGRP